MTRSLNLGLRMLCFILCLVCLLSVVRPLEASATGEEKTVATTLTTLVHSSASKSSTVIGQMENGMVVTVLKTRRDFYRIDCYDMKGYVAKSQVEKREDGKYYINCNPKSSETRVLTYVDHEEALTLRQSLLELAKKQLGSRYVYGGMRPGAFDCSGLTSYLYKNHGISLHRTASLQLQDGVIVPEEALQVGDILFFKKSNGYPANHVGIYAGNNMIIHAGRKGVVCESLDGNYFQKYFLCARRIINTGMAQVELPVTGTVESVLNVNSVSGRTAQ